MGIDVATILSNIWEFFSNIVDIEFLSNILEVSIGTFFGGYFTFGLFKRQEFLKIKQQLRLDLYKEYKSKYNPLLENYKRFKSCFQKLLRCINDWDKENIGIEDQAIYYQCINDLNISVIEMITNLDNLKIIIFSNEITNRAVRDDSLVFERFLGKMKVLDELLDEMRKEKFNIDLCKPKLRKVYHTFLSLIDEYTCLVRVNKEIEKEFVSIYLE